MKKLIILPIAILFLATIVTAIQITGLDMDTNTQVRLIEDNIAYANNGQIIFRNEDGITKIADFVGINATNFIKQGVTEYNTKNIYYICLPNVLCKYDYNTNILSPIVISSYGFTNPKIIAVTDNYYLFTDNVTFDNITVIDKITLTELPPVSGLPSGGFKTSFRCHRENFLDFNKYYCNNPMYLNDTNFVIPAGRIIQTTGANYYYFLELKENGSGVEYVSHANQLGNVGDWYEYNDMCTKRYYNNSWRIVCTAGLNVWASEYPGGMLRYPGMDTGQQHMAYQITDDGLLIKGLGQQSVGDKHPTIYYDGDPTIDTDDEVIYAGDAISLLSDAVSGGKLLGDTFFYLDENNLGKQTSIGNVYETGVTVFARTYKSSLLYDDSLDNVEFLRYEENGTFPQVTFPYRVDPVLEINFEDEPEYGVYERANNKNLKGSQSEVKIITQIDTIELTPYIGVDCDSTYTQNYLEDWGGDATDLTVNYNIVNPWARVSFENSILTGFADTTGLQGIILSQAVTENLNYVITSYSTEETSFAQDFYITDNLSLYISLTDKFDVTQVDIGIDTTGSTFILTINGDVIINENEVNYIDAVYSIAFTIYNDRIIYNLNDQLFGSVQGVYILPIRNIRWDIDTNNETFFILGAWALFDDGLYPEMEYREKIGSDQFNNSYYIMECDYTEFKDVRVTGKLYYGYLQDNFENIIPFTYLYDSYSEEFLEEVGAVTDVDTQANSIQAGVCNLTNLCNEGERLLFAIIFLIALTFGAYSYMEKNYQATITSELVPVGVFIMGFIFFAVYKFFPGWFTALAIIGVAVVASTKFSLLKAFSGRGGNTGGF